MAELSTLGPIPARRGAARSSWRRLRRNPVTLAALAVLAALLLAAALAPLLAPFDPDATDAAAALESLSWRHWLGTDAPRTTKLGTRLVLATTRAITIPFQ